MDHSLGAVDLSAISYQDGPIFSPDPFEQLDREDFLRGDDGIIQPDPSNSQFPAATKTPNPNPSMDHSFSPEPFDFDQLDVVNMLRDDSSNGAQQDTDPAGDTAAPMEIVHLEELDLLQVNGHQGPHPAGDVVGPSTDIGVGKAPGELADVNSLETNGTGLKQPEPCSVDIDFSTATDREIIDHFRALAEHRKDKEEVPPKFDDDLAHLEPWKLQVNKRTYYRATNMLDLDEKTLDGGVTPKNFF
jgi:hypothetical protein